jgi:hypothetical protein
MNETSQIDEAVFRRAIPPAVQALRIIYLVLVIGIAIILALILFLHVLDGSNTGDDTSLRIVQILTFVHVVVAFSLYVVASVLPSVLLSPAALERSRARNPSIAPVDLALDLIRRALLLRLVLFEGTALLGLIVCMLGELFGVLRAQPIYWLNVVTTFILFAYVAANFPSEERLVRINDRLTRG